MSAALSRDARARSRCDMAPLVEARRDGRVGDREAASLDRHLSGCASCRALAEDLERLAGLASGGRIAPLSPIAQRRERLRLLRDAAFAPAATSGLRARSRVQIVRFAAAAAMILGVLAGGTALALLVLPSEKAAPQRVESISSASTAPSGIARAMVPASVEAPAAAPLEAPVIAAPSALAPKGAARSAPIAAAPRLVGPRPKKKAANAAPAASASEAGKPGEGASALADGVELIERGDYGAAAERLRAFRQSHPTDERAEDAAFLAVLALERAGHHAAAVAAAREYLASYPQGYRRAEAQSISTALEARVGKNYLLAVTADHGMPSLPPSPDHRHFTTSIADLLNEKFDPEGKQLVTSFEAENCQISIDEERLAKLGLTLRDLARFLESQPYMFAVFTNDEVRRAVEASKTRHAGASSR